MFKGKKGKVVLMLMMSMLVVFAAACGNNANSGNTENNGGAATNNVATNAPTEEAAKLSGEIKIDGSSTVFPLTEAAAEEFNKEHADVRVPVGVSGTGGGFKQFCAAEIAIADASRPIKDEEATACKDAGIEYTELSVAFDGLSVVVSKDNDFIDHLTVEELNKIFMTGSTVKTWKDVRDTFPAEPIVMFSPGADSGTYDYFNEAILDKAGIRNDEAISFSEDDNALVQGVSGSKYGIGYFGFAYFEENADKLKVVPIDGGSGPIEPTYDTIKDGSYAPLSRPLFIYVNNKELERPEVKEFAKFYIDNIGALAGEVGYVALPDEQYATEAAKIQ
ncbi:PstS family phosphate ABC transporter substrate-binding protein [Paenibacillus harenae]|uniref:Phosphate-binding protein n=1 Tax=Paenibacillus harenae TaxID=306543 RepID=A0ABT9U3Y7_PAEHA|nr:PstS family phosphate ABC transporter substrate-binding protein [Paenibacillus harenae]MDQ0058811.1 phosphate transport system substrate-binding protein [Paenibacillus harenae]MDQ0114273.1 phosphate transport system substrate-binding protein [Paenibacillus harenae]